MCIGSELDGQCTWRDLGCALATLNRLLYPFL